MIVEVGPIEHYKDAIDSLVGGTWDELASMETWRQDFPDSPHKDTETVYLSMADLHELDDILNAKESYVREILVDSPGVQEVISDCMHMVGANKLGRTMLISLNPGGVISSHCDEGDYAAIYRRYHLPIITNDKVEFISDGDSYYLKEGMLYELENKKEHSVYNRSVRHRLHLVMDMQLLSEL